MRYYHIQAFSNGFKVIDAIWLVSKLSKSLIASYRRAGLFVRVRPVVN
jgi:hypothetical protein